MLLKLVIAQNVYDISINRSAAYVLMLHAQIEV